MDYCFALWALEIKRHALKKRPSNDDVVRGIFRSIFRGSGTTNKNGDDDWVAKETVSLLLSRKIDLPKTIRAGLLSSDFERLCKEMNKFYKDIFLSGEAEKAAKDLVEYYRLSENYGDGLSRKPSVFSNDAYRLLTFLLVESARINNKVYGERRQIFASGNNTLNYMFDDIIKISFSKKAARKRIIVVIPVDADFHFHVTKSGNPKPCVSPNTIHGKWVIKLGTLGVSERSIKEKAGHHSNGKIGDIEVFEYQNVLFYLLACSKFDEKNVAHATKEDIEFALKSLLRYHDEYGQGDELFLPLFGTGNSRAKLGIVESFGLIKEAVLGNQQWHNGPITIVVHNSAIKYAEELEANASEN